MILDIILAIFITFVLFVVTRLAYNIGLFLLGYSNFQVAYFDIRCIMVGYVCIISLLLILYFIGRHIV